MTACWEKNSFHHSAEANDLLRLIASQAGGHFRKKTAIKGILMQLVNAASTCQPDPTSKKLFLLHLWAKGSKISDDLGKLAAG